MKANAGPIAIVIAVIALTVFGYFMYQRANPARVVTNGQTYKPGYAAGTGSSYMQPTHK